MAKPFRLLRLVFAIGVLTLGSALVAPSAAQATPFPEHYLADSAGHAYCFVANFDDYPEHRSRVHWGMDRLDDQTQMYDIFESCAQGTDIWFSRVDLPGNDRGQTSCQRWAAASKCDSSVIWIDFIEINEGSWDVEDQQKTVVHEIGHSIGLGHHSPDAHNCAMYVGEIPSNDLRWRSFQVDAYEQSLTGFRTVADRPNEAKTLANLGDTHRAAGRPEAARRVWQRAVDILDELGHPAADEVRAKLAQGSDGGR